MAKETQVSRCPGCGGQAQTKAEDDSRRPRKDRGSGEGALGGEAEGCELEYIRTRALVSERLSFRSRY